MNQIKPTNAARRALFVQSASERWIILPLVLNIHSCEQVVTEFMQARDNPRVDCVHVEFYLMRQVDPEGVALLSSLVDLTVTFSKRVVLHYVNSVGAQYLCDTGFFDKYSNLVPNGGAIASAQRLRTTKKPATLPLADVSNSAFPGFLHFKFVPWVSHQLLTDEETLSVYSACIAEIFQNISHHAERTTGLTFSEYFPQTKSVVTAVSDCGLSIPVRVRTVFPDYRDDECLRKACEEGFTTKTNVRNRGAGLNLLLTYVVETHGGRVTIISGRARLSAVQEPRGMRIRTRLLDWTYPGTLVLVQLNADRLSDLARDVEPEDFQW